MLSSDVLRGYTDTIILSLLLDEPNYGYEISEGYGRSQMTNLS